MVKDQDYLKKTASFCIDLAKKLGATDSTAAVMHSISETVNFRNKKLDESDRSDSLGVSLTTYIGKKKSSISSSNLTEENIKTLVERCIETTKITPEDEYNSLPDKDLLANKINDLNLYDDDHIENDEKIEYLKIPHELYFARSAPFWDDGAIAFIKSKPSQLNFSYGKAYLITKEQFFEIVNQENTQFSSKYSSKSYSESIDFKELKKSKFINLGPKDENIEYGKVIYLGEKDEFPIITFTSKYDFDEDDINPPSQGYLSVIIKGLIDYREFNSIQNIHSYLFSKQGISKHYSSEKLFKLIHEIKMK